MSLPAPTFVAAHAVFQLADRTPLDPSLDEVFIASVRSHFPNVTNRTLLPQDAPPMVPHLTLASTSSQLALSSVQADFEVRFYGDYLADISRGIDYVEQKLNVILAAFDAMGARVSMVGLIGTLHFSFGELDGDGPAAHVMRTHLRTELAPAELQDALARVALKLRDTYFVTLTLSNYESRVFERPIIPGVLLQVRPWEGRVEDTGLELVIDINNNLEARTAKSVPVVTVDGVRAATGILREIAQNAGPEYAESGRVSVENLALSSAT